MFKSKRSGANRLMEKKKKVKAWQGKAKKFSVRCDQGHISHFWPQLVKAEEERGGLFYEGQANQTCLR